MAVQTNLTNSVLPFFLEGEVFGTASAVIEQDAARTTDLVQFTLMGQKAANRKWVPFTSLTATDGTAARFGIYTGDDIAAADLVAGDVTDMPMVTVGSGTPFDQGRLVIENSLTLNSVIADGINTRTVGAALELQGLIPEVAIRIDTTS